MDKAIAELQHESLIDRVAKIKDKLKEYHVSGKKLFATSSFQPQSLPLLHILSGMDFVIPIYFLDTGYLFPETYLFKDQLIKLLNLTVITLKANSSMLMQIDQQHRFLFMTNPDRCCAINKVLPLEPVLQSHDVWISGVRASQSETRKKMSEEDQGKFGITRYHPLLQWTSKEIYYYSKSYQLPEHPLHSKGYESIGCIPCTAKIMDDQAFSRKGRWAGMKKEECGLHTELLEKKSI
ncbi:phosphoadenylyl-sulfate reductase [Legionella londiniensis]|uniref:Adenosine 5'-phosphosulfate reductase n=1 Tax=Legionella londiniensis TaxID=45068 RepID=A0A0W0VNX3_9GAMM|nr:phosphoadenylyl-sulfate reductase [Legionella londiniensis]KTD21645.1 Phosphoadenosine phosphosulfate reductase [Legionella londiniensis]STX93521.1 Phosphoadenosine phosphosulfate reductase [Legionella londiniensis]